MRCCAKEKRGGLLEPIYCDNHLLVLEKPAGIVTQPDFHELAKEWVKREFSKKGRVFLEPIHRLDKPASGIVVFARTSKALSRLNESLRNKKWRKFYFALVEGELPSEGRLEHYLTHGDFCAHVVDEKEPGAKLAMLTYERKKIEKGRSLIEVELLTGRYHQIRAQFGAIGHPIWGDGKYGSRTKKETISLHHHKIELVHPTTKETLTFQCPAAFFS